MPSWVVGLPGRIIRGSVLVKIRVISGAFSYLAIWGNKRVLTTGYLLEDAVAKILHEHLLLGFHVFNNNVLGSNIWVVLECVLVLHDAGPGLLVPHLHQDSTKGRVGGVVAGFSWKLSHSFNDVSIDIYAWSTD